MIYFIKQIYFKVFLFYSWDDVSGLCEIFLPQKTQISSKSRQSSNVEASCWRKGSKILISIYLVISKFLPFEISSFSWNNSQKLSSPVLMQNLLYYYYLSYFLPDEAYEGLRKFEKMTKGQLYKTTWSTNYQVWHSPVRDGSNKLIFIIH